MLSTALNEASNAGGHWLNAAGKGFPKFYPRGVAVSPFNGLFMALHSDRNGCKTNLFTLYSDAKARGTSVREHEQGVPFLFYNWNKYVHRNNPEDIISRDAYLKLDEEVQKQYKGIHNREIRTLFNIDQTTLPYVDKEEYDMVLLKDGSAVERGYSEADERRLHIRFNDFLLKMRDNLVPVSSDGSGMPHYETDRDAVYTREVVIDLDKLEPTVSMPHLPENTKVVSEVAGLHIDQVVIGSCTNGRIQDLREAAAILKGKKVAENVRCIVIPATQEITLQAMKEGLLEIFIASGCAVSAPTCGPCLGGHMGVMAEGERCVSTTNRNFVGRMGHVQSEVILASPAVAAASAVAGCVADPRI